MSRGKKIQSDLLVVLSILTYTVALSLFTIAKHNSFSTYAWDLGIFNQGFWTTTFQDKIFQYTCERHLVESGSFFGIHFSPVLFAIVPIYYLFPSATTLLAVQSLVLGVSVVPIYKMAQTRFTTRQSVLIGALYLMNPALHGVNCYDFHVQAFLPLVLNYLIYYTYEENQRGIIMSINLALMVQEQVFYLILAYLGFMVFRVILLKENSGLRKRVPLFLMVLVTAIAWRFISGQVINYYNPDIPDHLKAGQHFAILGVTDPADIPFQIILEPSSVLRALVFQWYDKLVYILTHLTPYLYIASQGALLLIPTAPWFAISLLSNYPPYYRIGFQYSAYLIPFVYNCFILGLSEEYNELPQRSRIDKLKLVSVLVIATSLAISPLSPFTQGFYLSPAYQKPDLSNRNQRLHEILSLIPDDASILTQDNLFPHVCGRSEAYVMVPSSFRDVKTWKTAMIWITTRNTDYLLIDLESDPHGTGRYILDIARREQYGLVSFYDNTYLYKKYYDSNPLQYELVNITYSVSDLVPQNMVQKPQMNSTFGYILSFQNRTINSRTLWHGPYAVMPRGNYTVDFHIKTLNDQLNEEIRMDIFTNKTVRNTIIFTENQLQNDTWTSIRLNFTLPDVVYDLEFRGILDGLNTTIQLDSIQLTQSP